LIVVVAGTLNLLVAAAARGLLDLPAAIRNLRATNFHVSDAVVVQALQADAKRKRPG
jgi:predicted nucleic acid-binding protein